MDKRVFLYLVFVNIYFVFSGVEAQKEVGDDCQSQSTRSRGQCTLLKSCPGAMKELQGGKQPQVCGFQGKEPIVCCAGTISSPVGTISTPAETPSLHEENERISRKKCKEYGELQFEEYEPLFLTLGPKPVKVQTCDLFATPLIIGGSNVRPKEFPHMALLGFGPQNETRWLCVGSLISEQFVLAAAHCLASPQDGPVARVRLGDLNINSDTDDAQPQEFSIVESIRHPQFVQPLRYHDIALLKLNRAVSFTKYIRPACLYTGVPPLADKQRFFVTGWNLHWDAEHSGEMQKEVLELFSHSECNATYENYINRRLKNGILPDSQICAGRRDRNSKCSDDVVGPLQIYSNVQCMYDIVGVSSFGKACGLADTPDVYTRVSHYLDWIEKIVWP